MKHGQRPPTLARTDVLRNVRYRDAFEDSAQDATHHEALACAVGSVQNHMVGWSDPKLGNLDGELPCPNPASLQVGHMARLRLRAECTDAMLVALCDRLLP